MPLLKIPHGATKTQHSQINNFFFENKRNSKLLLYSEMKKYRIKNKEIENVKP